MRASDPVLAIPVARSSLQIHEQSCRGTDFTTKVVMNAGNRLMLPIKRGFSESFVSLRKGQGGGWHWQVQEAMSCWPEHEVARYWSLKGGVLLNPVRAGSIGGVVALVCWLIGLGA